MKQNLRPTCCRQDTFSQSLTFTIANWNCANGYPARRCDSLSWARSTQLRSMFLATKKTFAGRSAKRRIKYGYHSVPNGM